MTMTMENSKSNTLARFKRSQVEGREHITWYWLVGEQGAVTTWFSDTRDVIGHSVCSGVTWHSPRERAGFEHFGPCEFLETECWLGHGSMIWLDGVVQAFDQGAEDLIYVWLATEYERLYD